MKHSDESHRPLGHDTASSRTTGERLGSREPPHNLHQDPSDKIAWKAIPDAELLNDSGMNPMPD